MQLVHHDERRVEPLQRTGLGGQRTQLGVRAGQVDPVAEHLHLLEQPRLQLDHPADGMEDETSLTLVARHAQDLRALDVVAEEGIGSEERSQSRLPVPPR